ncbi:hypothetical protein Ancab_032742 [Ancistrocladus abbreviatus]
MASGDRNSSEYPAIGNMCPSALSMISLYSEPCSWPEQMRSLLPITSFRPFARECRETVTSCFLHGLCGADSSSSVSIRVALGQIIAKEALKLYCNTLNLECYSRYQLQQCICPHESMKEFLLRQIDSSPASLILGELNVYCLTGAAAYESPCLKAWRTFVCHLSHCQCTYPFPCLSEGRN